MDDREIQVQEIRKMLNMSSFQFINLLNRTDKHLITSFDEGFWEHQENIYATGSYFKRTDLDNPALTVHILDLQDFIKDNPELSTNEVCVNLDGAQSIDLGNAQTQIDILKRDNMALQATLQEKNTRIAELEQQLKETEAQLDAPKDDQPAKPALSLSEHGLAGKVITCRNEGMSDEEIAQILKRQGMSVSQIGALIYHGDNVDTIKHDSLKTYAKRILKEEPGK